MNADGKPVDVNGEALLDTTGRTEVAQELTLSTAGVLVSVTLDLWCR